MRITTNGGRRQPRKPRIVTDRASEQVRLMREEGVAKMKRSGKELLELLPDAPDELDVR